MQHKKLTLTDCLMLIMGSMIGSGIFIVPAAMSRTLGSPLYLLLAWILTAFMTVCAALCYGELAAMMPKAGGQYIYLQKAYGRLAGFLYGWTLFTVIQTGTIAAVAVAFAKFTGVFFDVVSEENVLPFSAVKISMQQLLAIAVVWILTVFNFQHVKKGALMQNVFGFTKIAAIACVILSGVYYLLNHTVSLQAITVSQPMQMNMIAAFSIAMVGSVFSSDAWNNVTFTGSEIENAGRNLPRSLFIGTASVMLIYIVMNVLYILVIPFQEIQHAPHERVGTLMLEHIFGSSGMYLMALLIIISTFGCINGLTLSGARVYYAMAQDGLFVKSAQVLNSNQSPQKALVMQAVWSTLLVLSGSYGDLLDYVVFAVLLFYILTVAAVFVLRKKYPSEPRSYKVFAYPYLPFIYIIMALTMCVCLLLYNPAYTLTGLLIVLSGIPVYFLIKSKNY
jgi:APA family basic amino acid/polyamine antiporter